MISVFPAHAPSDASFAGELSRFLEAGCDVVCSVADAMIPQRRDLISTADTGLSADVLILLLSKASNPKRWPREIWEPILFRQAPEMDTRVALLLLEECEFPDLLRRRLKFIDATSDRLAALRRVKRWIRGDASKVFSADLDTLYRELNDSAGMVAASGALAQRFAEEAEPDFDAVLWIPSHGRTLTAVAGELGAQLGMILDGELDDNCRRIREVLSARRCLVVFDAPQTALEPLLPSGRSSVLMTAQPVRIENRLNDLTAARRFVSSRRFAEAYEILRRCFDAGIETESCARELVWICDHWGRHEEAAVFRSRFRIPPSEQLSLFY